MKRDKRLGGQIAGRGAEGSAHLRDVCEKAVKLALSCLLLLPACSSEPSGGENPGTGDVSLANDVMPLIDKTCGGCHTRTEAPFPPAVENGVYYDDKEDLLALVGTFIVPGDSAKSGFVAILNQSLSVGQGPTPMPPPMAAPPMAEVDVAVVMRWIDEGAKDN